MVGIDIYSGPNKLTCSNFDSCDERDPVVSDGLADLKQIQYRVKKGNNGVGWSNLALFAIFEKQQVSADPVYFYTIAENRHFQKNTGTLKIILFVKFAETFIKQYIKEQKP